MSYANSTFTEDVSYDPTTYPDQGAAQLPTPGVYRFRATSIGRKKNRDSGEPVLTQGKWPVIMLNRVEIVEPTEENGAFAVFEEISTNPFMRKVGSAEIPGSRHMDLLRSIDQDASPGGFEAAIGEVESLLTSGQTFVATLGYKATDVDWAKAQLALVGDKNAPKDVVNRIWNEARYTTKDFKNPNGGYRTKLVGKSGKTLDAKLALTKFFPSNSNTDLGAYTK